MSASSLKPILFTMVVALGVSSTAKAQLDDPCSPFYGCSNDMQFFEPVDLDLDCRGCCEQCGFHFSYEKLAWAITGERVELGDPTAIQRWFNNFDGTPVDPTTGEDILPPVIPNSIMDAVPRASWHTGDRYELGYWHENGTGWLMGILNGPDQEQFETFGLNGGVMGGFQTGLRNPVGDVFVAFRTDPGLLAGFIDRLHDFDVGPGGGILPDDENGNGVADGDGIADDLNANNVYGPDGFSLDGVTFLGVPTDYGDLVIIPISFGTVNIKNSTHLNGFELMRAHRIDNSHFKVANQNNHFEWGYGARYLQIDDRFMVDALAVEDSDWSIGNTQINSRIMNNIVGPQVTYKWRHVRGRWQLSSTGRFMWGFNIRDWRQRGFIGEQSIPGQNNSPLMLPTQSFAHGRSDHGFSPTAELRLDLEYRLTDNIRLQLGYTGTFVDNIRRASVHNDYRLNESGNVMGFANVNEGQEIFASGVNGGVVITQ